MGNVSDLTPESVKGLEQLSEAIQKLSEQVQKLIDGRSQEENLKLNKYKDNHTLIEFTLVTSGIIRGYISWIGDQSIGISTESGNEIILYKHSISFLQEYR